jgi:hypothetical protein
MPVSLYDILPEDVKLELEAKANGSNYYNPPQYSVAPKQNNTINNPLTNLGLSEGINYGINSMSAAPAEAATNSISFGGMSVPTATESAAIYAPESASTIGAAMPYAGPAAVALIGAYTAKKGYDAYKNSQYSSKNPMTGFKEGLKAAGPLKYVPVLGQVPALAGAVGAMFGSGKDKDQHARDQIRKTMIDSGIIDSNYMLNGMDIGKDGGFKTDKGLHTYDVDLSDPNSAQNIADLNPLAAVLSGGSDKGTSDTVGMLNYALKGDKSKVVEQYNKAGGHDAVWAAIDKLDIDENKKNAYKNGLSQLYGLNGKSSNNKSSKGGSGSSKPKGQSSTNNTEAASPVNLASLLPTEVRPPVMPEPDNKPINYADLVSRMYSATNQTRR